MDKKRIIESARGMIEADLLLTNARIINVFSGEIVPGNIAISEGIIIGTGDLSAKKTIDLKNAFVTPGFIDSHVHIESSMSCVSEFARCVLSKGTTTVVADPHEIANVLGLDGIRYMLESSKEQPMNIFFTLPSCVPATDMETSGANLNADDLKPLISHDRVVALAEMMNYPGVLFNDPSVMAKIEIAENQRKPVDGHAPGLTGGDLSAYISAGISSDHECTTVQEAKEKLMAGMHIMVREGTGAKNLDNLFPMINRQTARRMMWCTDDRHPHDLLEQGHIDYIVRRAIKKGLDPVTAIQMATINPSEYFGLNNIGAIAPGRRADLLVISDLDHLSINRVYSAGILAVENGELNGSLKKPDHIPIRPSMNIEAAALNFTVKAAGDTIRVIDIIPDQLITNEIQMSATIQNGIVLPDLEQDVIKISVIERHTGSGNIAIGFVKGFGLKNGALASSVAHDSHNIITVGTNDEDMKTAVTRVIEMKGGLAAACENEITASLPLPVAGLMSEEPVKDVQTKLDELLEHAKKLGCKLKDPFMTLSFLALPVIPDLKITDQGLVDVKQFKKVPLFVE